MCRMLATATRIFVIVVWGSVNVCAQARPQFSDNVEQGMLFHRNAVAPTARSDWQTARPELLEAEKLAPQNALVDYDLDLAYLQHNVGSSVSPKHSLDEILGWLQNTINQQAGEHTPPIAVGGDRSVPCTQETPCRGLSFSFDSRYSLEFQGTALVLKQNIEVKTIAGGSGIPWTSTDNSWTGVNIQTSLFTMTFSLRDLDPGAIRVEPKQSKPSGGQDTVQVSLQTTNSANKIAVKVTSSIQCGIVINGYGKQHGFGDCEGHAEGEVLQKSPQESADSTLKIPFDAKLAPRVVNAFRDAVVQAGGKKSAKEIY